MSEFAEGNGVGPRVKICGLTRRSDAEFAASVGADFLGVVGVPESPRARSADQAGEILSGLDPEGVVVLAETRPEAVVEFATRSGASVLQLHGDEEVDLLAGVRAAGPWTLWKAVRVQGPEDAERALDRYAELVDGFLWDGWHPDRLGGSGVSFPWDALRSVRESFPAEKTLVVAGGLTPENVAEVIARLRPDVVDVSSGVETSPGIKDPDRVSRFVRAARTGVPR